ncbi:MAG: hypothetical protein DME41_11820, partial [Verrucomicrobia bacterium]
MNVVASTAAAIRLPAPNGASNHTPPNAQAIAMMAARRTSSAPTHRMDSHQILHYRHNDLRAQQAARSTTDKLNVCAAFK